MIIKKMAKQTQVQQQVQRQLLAPVQMQFIQMIEMPSMYLEDEIKRALDENPALEVDDEPLAPDSCDDYSDVLPESADNEQDSDLQAEVGDIENDADIDNYYDADEYDLPPVSADERPRYDRFAVAEQSFHDQLIEQLSEQFLTERERTIAEFVIGNLDDSGYLRTPNLTIVNDLLLTYNFVCDEAEVERVITHFIHELEPIGVGARDLRECLLLQLKRQKSTADTALATQILTDFFEEFSKKHYEKITKKLDISEAALKLAIAEIQKLNPRPGDNQSSEERALSYITPDFIITNDNDELTLSLNNNFLPKLRVNGDFLSQYQHIKQKKMSRLQAGNSKFVKENVEKANLFINLLTQREITLYQTMLAIMEVQRGYFLSGDDADLKPMILEDIAARTGFDTSTISRVTSSKYVATFFGTIPLKRLFSESVGEDDVSSREVKSILVALISGEDKKKPLNDSKLSALLAEKNYHIARRTVAKYREELQIPVARLRKIL